MVKKIDISGRYEEDFRRFAGAGNANGATWLRPMREHAWSRFKKMGFPTPKRGNEEWKYTNLNPLARAEFSFTFERDGRRLAPSDLRESAPWDDGWVTLVFVDGQFAASLSSLDLPDGLSAGNLADAASARTELVQRHLGRHAPVEQDAFAALNTAFLRDGAFVLAHEGAQVSRPVHLLFVTTEGERPGVTYPRILAIAEPHSSLTLVETHLGLGDQARFTDAVAELDLGEGASVRHYRVLSENERTFHVGISRVYQSADSSFASLSFSTGPAIGRNDLHTWLDAPGSVSTLEGLYMTTNRQHLDNHISTTHSKPSATSHQYFKGILAGQSRAVFSGRVLVERDAQKSYADQKDLNLLLSPGAEIDTKPSLEIYADDVKCFHGATAGHVDANALFYLRSRGIDLETATAMMIRGFASEIVEKIELDSLRSYVERVTDALLPQLRYEIAV